MTKAKIKKPTFITALTLILVAALSLPKEIPALPSEAVAKSDSKGNALALVAEVLKGGAGLRSPSNRIKIRSLGVTLIAAFDPALAKATCREIEMDFTELFGAVREGAEAVSKQDVDSLRADAIRSIADADASLAIELLRNTSVLAQQVPIEAAPDDVELEVYVASRLIDRDLNKAYDLIRQLQPDKFPSLLPDILQRLSERDMRMARDAADSLAERLLRVNLATRPDAFFTAVGLITLSRSSGGGHTPPQGEGWGMLSREKERALFNHLVTAAVGRQGAANGLAQQLAGLLPAVANVAPETAATLRRQLESPRRQAGQAGAVGSDFWDRTGDLNVAEAVGLIGREPKETREALYQQAAFRAISSGDAALARGIAERFVTRAYDRQEILRQVSCEEALKAIAAGDIMSARVQLAQASPEERARLLIKAAKSIQAGKDPKQPLNLLEEAGAALGGQPKNVAQLGLRLQLAEALMRYNAARAGDILEAAVYQLNEVLATAAVLDGYLSDGPILKDGELDLSNSSALIALYFNCSHGLAALAQYDYERTIAIASQFQRPEVQMMSKLLAAEGVLSRAKANGGDRTE